MKSTFKQAEMDLRAELLECKTEKTKLDEHLDEEEEVVSNFKALAKEMEKLHQQA